MVSSTVGSLTITGWKRRSRRRILFDVLAVFVQCGGTDAVQLAPGQHGLEQVAGIHGALGLAGAHNGVQLINKQDDPALRLSAPPPARP